MPRLKLKDLYDGFRNPRVIEVLAKTIHKEAGRLDRDINIMEVCGGHTHSIMKYGISQLMPKNIRFIHGPGCPVCIMPKERIDHACILAEQEDTILLTLGDMIKVPGSRGSLQDARSRGADVRFIYSPMDALKIAKEHPKKKVVFFAIGFETTTPMTTALIEAVLKQKINNLFFHINHVTIPEVMRKLLDDTDQGNTNSIDAFLGPSHVSVITGSRIYEVFSEHYDRPVVVSGFEPVDVLESILMIIRQFNEGRCELEVQYNRLVSYEGNRIAQALIDKYFEKSVFKWRGIGDVAKSSYRLKDAYGAIDAQKIYADILPDEAIQEHELCICGDILKGVAKPSDCTIFATACKPATPVGSCMVSSEGACAAYYKYGNLIDA